MWTVVIALLPALLAAYLFFGWRSIWITILGVVAAVGTEALVQFFTKRPVTISDGSAVVTGMLLAFNLPP